MKLGKSPFKPDSRDFLFTKYADVSALPKVPRYFGHEKDVVSYGMLGNDQYGDCVLAGAAHETMIWNKEAGRNVSFSDSNVLSDYSAITGFTPSDHNSDQGTNVRDALSYRRKTGVIDSSGKRHKILAYLQLEPGNIAHLHQAMYMFGLVGIGIQFPASAMQEFNAGQVWRVRSSQIDGGHYVPLVARRNYLSVITWGKIQQMTTAFYKKYCDEAWVILTDEMFTDGKTPEGFDLQTLQNDLSKL